MNNAGSTVVSGCYAFEKVWQKSGKLPLKNLDQKLFVVTQGSVYLLVVEMFKHI